MVKKIIIRHRRRADHFSLKKLVKKVGNVVGDTVKATVIEPVKATAKVAGIKTAPTNYRTGFGELAGKITNDVQQLGAMPIKQTISSVTGKHVAPDLNFGISKIINKGQSAGANLATSSTKGFADTLLGGLPTKAANLVRKDKYKEKPFQYGEMGKAAQGPDTGIKLLDKAGEILPKAGAVGGAVVAGVVAGNKMLSIAKKQSADNMKESEIEIGPNVLTGEPAIGAPGQPPINTLQAGFFELTPTSIGLMVVAIIVLIMLAKRKGK